MISPDNENYWKTVTTDLELDPSQQRAFNRIQQWLQRKDKPTLAVGGLAGTGKSFLISKIIGDDPDIAVISFTGKAVNVLRSKGIKQAVTMHQLLYDFRGSVKGQPIFTRKEDIDNFKLIVVDEASMVSTSLASDLLRHEIPVLWVGDHGQLEPVGGASTSFVRDPDVVLEQIHRQAEGSSILDFAYHLREGKDPFRFKSTDEVKIFEEGSEPDEDMVPDIVLVGTNHRRIKLNQAMCKGEVPEAGEPLVILKNNYTYGLFNGQIVTIKDVLDITHDNYILLVNDGQRDIEIPCWQEQFNSMELVDDRRARYSILADYGYAITAHKSQGSQWSNVLVYEGEPKEPRWQYTAATRAAKQLWYVPAGKDWTQVESLSKLRERKKAKPMPKFAVSGLELLKQKVKNREQ